MAPTLCIQYTKVELRKQTTCRDMLEFTLGGPQVAIHVCRMNPKTVKRARQTLDERADMHECRYVIRLLWVSEFNLCPHLSVFK